MNIVEVLRRCEVFVGLDDNALEKIARLSSWRRYTYSTGDFIFHENAVAEDFYILEKGEARLIVVQHNGEPDEPEQVAVDTITKGDVFGWSSLVAPHFLTMSAICVKPSSVLAVGGIELTKLIDSDHSLGYEVMKGLVRVIGARLRDLRVRLAGKGEVSAQAEVHLE